MTAGRDPFVGPFDVPAGVPFWAHHTTAFVQVTCAYGPACLPILSPDCCPRFSYFSLIPKVPAPFYCAARFSRLFLFLIHLSTRLEKKGGAL